MKKEYISRFSLAAALLLALSVSACGGEDGQQYPDGQAVPVEAITLKEEAIVQTIRLPGRVNAYRIAEIRPQVTGVIMKRTFTEGAQVKEGQQLYQIDPALYEATHQSAVAELKRARANVQAVQAKENRYAELVAINAVSKQEYDDIKATLAQARADVAVTQANVTTAKVNLDYTKVYSPISGRIGKSSVTEGALVTANQPQALAQVTQLDPIYVDMSQPSADLMRLGGVGSSEGREDIAVALELEDGRKYEHQGTLQFSEVTVDATTSSVQLRAIFPNPDGLLMPGLFVQADIIMSEQQAVLIPQRAAQRDPQGQLSVWRIGEDGTVNPVPVSATEEYQGNWIITSGVQAGDRIVTAGFQKIQPGAAVQTPEQMGQGTATGQPHADADMPADSSDNP